MQYNYQIVKNNLEQHGFYLDVEEKDFKGVTLTNLFCHDSEGYRYKIIYDSIMKNKGSRKVQPSNPFSIDNINLFLQKNNCPFICISTKYISKKDILSFKCLRCNEIIKTSWGNINRTDNPSRYLVKCPNCDVRNESLHAIILKQLFMHNYPDTIVEEKSCINPKTNKIMPTDIVNHRLKIAIEIQSQWHDFEDKKEKDLYKKNFWIKKGYSFYDPDIRDYSILDMCKLFFDIDKIPEYIDYNYGHKMNIKEVQEMLNNGMDIPTIAKIKNIKTHSIYDAIHFKQLTYPKNYLRADYTPVIQFDLNWNYITEYKTIKEAGIINNLNPQSLSSALYEKRNYFGGYNWMKKRDYIANNKIS